MFVFVLRPVIRNNKHAWACHVQYISTYAYYTAPADTEASAKRRINRIRRLKSLLKF